MLPVSTVLISNWTWFFNIFEDFWRIWRQVIRFALIQQRSASTCNVFPYFAHPSSYSPNFLMFPHVDCCGIKVFVAFNFLNGHSPLNGCTWSNTCLVSMHRSFSKDCSRSQCRMLFCPRQIRFWSTSSSESNADSRGWWISWLSEILLLNNNIAIPRRISVALVHGEFVRISRTNLFCQSFSNGKSRVQKGNVSTIM